MMVFVTSRDMRLHFALLLFAGDLAAVSCRPARLASPSPSPAASAVAGLSLLPDPPQGLLGACGEKFISDPVPAGSLFFLGTVYVLILPALAHAFLGFLAELPAAWTLGPNSRWELVEMNRDLSHLALFGRRKE